MIVPNSLMMTLMTLGQLLMRLATHLSPSHPHDTASSTPHRDTRAVLLMSGASTATTNAHHSRAARRFGSLVMSHILCWFIIGLLGLLASIGVAIPGDVNVAMAIVVPPVNSALNPFLYTLCLVRERRQKAQAERVKKLIVSRIKAYRPDDSK